MPKLASIPEIPVGLDLVRTGTSVAVNGYGCENGVGEQWSEIYRLKYGRTRTISPPEAINEATDFKNAVDREKVGARYLFTPGAGKDPSAASICPGDSGGPVYRLDEAGKPIDVVGVNSYYDFLPKEIRRATRTGTLG